jgi:hypothetical protein
MISFSDPSNVPARVSPSEEPLQLCLRVSRYLVPCRVPFNWVPSRVSPPRGPHQKVLSMGTHPGGHFLGINFKVSHPEGNIYWFPPACSLQGPQPVGPLKGNLSTGFLRWGTMKVSPKGPSREQQKDVHSRWSTLVVPYRKTPPVGTRQEVTSTVPLRDPLQNPWRENPRVDILEGTTLRNTWKGPLHVAH